MAKSMRELFFHMGDTRTEMRHLEKATAVGMSRSDLCACAKIVASKYVKEADLSMAEKKSLCDRLVSRGLTPTAIPASIS